jgi:hypothetical protein
MFNFEGYNKEKITVSIVRANVFGVILIIPAILIFGLPYYFIWNEQFKIDALIEILQNLVNHSIYLRMGVIILLIFGGIILHELIHGLVWAFYAESRFKAIKFGVMWKMLTPYCHCTEPLKVYQYITGAIMPGILLGIIPGIVAICCGNLGLLLWGIFFTIAACGDFIIVWLLRNEKSDDFAEDHPREAGCYIYRKKISLR